MTNEKKGGWLEPWWLGTLVMSPKFFLVSTKYYKIQKELSGAAHGQLHLLSLYF
jgi:hypothetical protein